LLEIWDRYDRDEDAVAAELLVEDPAWGASAERHARETQRIERRLRERVHRLWVERLVESVRGS